MNEQLLGLIRHVLTFVGGILIAKGVIDEATSTQIIGGVTAIVGAVWSYLKNKQITPVA